MKKMYFVFVLILLFSCSEDDKTIDIVTENIERGAVLRNIDKISKDFVHTDFESAFQIVLEEQDSEDGGLLDFVRLYVSYEDRNMDNGNQSAIEQSVRDIPRSDFDIGPVNLPRTTLTFAYQEAIEVLDLEQALILPGDQFKLRLDLHLTDGRTFSNDSGSATIFTDICFFRSPYRYEITVVEPLVQQTFTGSYTYEFISGDVLDFETQDGTAFLTESEFESTRNFDFGFAEPMEITFAGSNVYTKIYQGVSAVCRSSSEIVLAGPDQSNFGDFQEIDDSVFFLDIVIGFEDWGGSFPANRLLRYRFTKQ